MQAVILAAGEGTRMRPLTHSTPKPMLPVADRPLVAHTADCAVRAGAEELVVVVGYEADDVREYFGEEYAGVPVRFAVQEEQLGTGHAVNCAREHIDGDFAVLYGDNLYDAPSIERLFSRGPSVAAYRVENPTNYGVLTLEDETRGVSDQSSEGGIDSRDGERVVDIVEKPDEPPTDLANAGAYVFPEEARDWLDVPKSERGEHEFTDVLARVIDEHEVQAVEVERWMDVGRPWELLAANEWKLADLEPRVEGEVRGDADLRGPVVVEAGAVVEAGVVIEGPALIRSGASVGPNAYVRGATLVGEDCHVGHSVELKNSVVMRGTNVPHLSYVGDSLLGPGVNLGAGTNVANLRHDGGDVRQTVKGERVSTGRRKYGVVAGDGAKTGINTSLAPGVVLSPGATTAPGESVSRDR
ncbi:bifunctional sugar-1-phosphate nucleotidylyltransferase/acetyltransferase [Halomarina pelagica]|uniref:bifunctional sugar-1-phosphate nucleotidylyltransferase/acetyltransferase n=1 Tax=Halomarina pelagica TaxID=2961599 RepID=UPI0020C5975E|nr:bifunctional sugar-1-phosphate nucleotidylyltransferase/acetyltransferase [Halomarina sp. BND7]